MSAVKAVLLIWPFLLALGGCSHAQHFQRSTPEIRSRAITGAEAIAIVRSHIQYSGGNPGGNEYSAAEIDVRALETEMKRVAGKDYRLIENGSWRDERWLVTARRIFYPNDQGSSRFVPDGFTSYFLSADGKILHVRGGP